MFVNHLLVVAPINRWSVMMASQKPQILVSQVLDASIHPQVAMSTAIAMTKTRAPLTSA
jgi:hypothetical protein